MKPDFIGIGGGRSGTSWIYNCLYEHPQLCLPWKEINFFSRDDRFGKGFEWYERHFRTCSRKSLTGEISVYLQSMEAPKRIFEYCPEVKLFVSLRDPIERAFSSYQNEIKAGLIDRSESFEAAVERRPILTERGLYSEALERYLQFFPREQLLVLIYEDALENPDRFIKTIFEFLNVDPDFTPSMLRKRVNVGGIPKSVLLDRVLNETAGVMRSLGMQKAMWAAKQLGIVGMIRGANVATQASPITGEEKAQLREFFSSDVKALELLIDRDLSFWMN